MASVRSGEVFGPEAVNNSACGANEIFKKSGAGGTVWECAADGGGGGGAPADATYITQTANGTLSNEQALGLLGTGLMFSTTTTGVVSIYGGAACTNQVIEDLSTAGAPTCSTITSSYVAADTLTPDQLADTLTLDANLNVSTGAYGVTFTVANPASDGVDINGTGAFAGDLLHVHQHTGNPTGGNLAHLEAADADITPLLHVEALSPSATGVADAIVGILVDTDDDDDASFRPILVQDDALATPDTLFAVDYTGTITTASVGAAAVTAGAIAATTDLAGALCGTNEILQDGGASWSCIATPGTPANYVATVADGTGIDGTATGAGSTYTPSLDLSEVNDVTWGTGAETVDVTFDALGSTGEPILRFSDTALTFDSTGTTGVDVNFDDSPLILFSENDANGSNSLQFQAPADISNTRTCTFESGADASFIPDSCVGDGTDNGSAIDAWPIGSVFIAVVSTNPNTLLGGGTWAAIGAGRVLVGYDSGDPDFDDSPSPETGGAKTVASSAQTFAGNASTTIVNHTHDVNVGSANDTNTVSGSGNYFAGTTNTVTATTGNPKSGGAASYTPTGTNTPGAATSVVQPYLVVYMWKRTA